MRDVEADQRPPKSEYTNHLTETTEVGRIISIDKKSAGAMLVTSAHASQRG